MKSFAWNDSFVDLYSLQNYIYFMELVPGLARKLCTDYSSLHGIHQK